MTAGGHRGRIITFYSYKGGVGRSMLLANVAWVLAFAGKKVLVVDWDLEAPGLEHYFASWLEEDLESFRTRRGVIDQLQSYHDLAEAQLFPDPDPEPDADDAGAFPSPELARLTEVAGVGTGEGDVWGALGDGESQGREFDPDASVLFPTPELRERCDVHAALGNITFQLSLPDAWTGEIYIIPAGSRDDPGTYAGLVASFDWTYFYSELEGQRFLGLVRDRMSRDYDYVLIDSRTGTSEPAAVSTIELADDLVACFGLNDQSIEGAAAVVETFLASREGRSARVFPVPMRVDRQRADRYGPAQQLYERIFNPLIARDVVNVGAYWADVEVPYETNYAFEEIAGPAAGIDPSADRYAAAYRQLARCLAPDVVRRELLESLESATAEIWRSEGDGARRQMTQVFTGVIISYIDADRSWERWLTWVAESRGLSVIPHSADEPLDRLRSRLNADVSYCLMPILSRHYATAPASHELWEWGCAELTKQGDRRLRPVCVELDLGVDGFDDAFGLVLAVEDEEVARRAVAEMLTVPIPREEAALGEPQGDPEPRQPDADLATAAVKPWFPGENLPLARRYERRLAEARRRADDHATMWNALLLAQELSGPGVINRVRLLFGEAVRLAERIGDTLTAAEAWLGWATAEVNHERYDLAVAYLDKARGLLDSVEFADGGRATRRRERLAARVALEEAALIRRSSRTGDKSSPSSAGPPESAQRLDDPAAEEAAADAAAERAERLAVEGQDDEAWRQFVLARYRYATRGNRPGEAYRTELALGQLARKVGSREDAERYYHDARATVERHRDRADWQARYEVFRRRADVELQAARSGGSPESRRESLLRSRSLYEDALGIVAPDDATAPTPPEHRAHIRDSNWYFGSATGLANVLDMLRQLDDAGNDPRATILRVEAVRRLNWRDVDPRLEHGEALRAGRDAAGLDSKDVERWCEIGRRPRVDLEPGPPGEKELLEHAVLALWVFDRLKNQPQADLELAWIARHRHFWGRDSGEVRAAWETYIRATVVPEDVDRLTARLSPLF